VELIPFCIGDWGVCAALPSGVVKSSQSYITTDGQPVSLSWNKALIWGLRPDLDYCLTVAGLLVWGALSDECVFQISVYKYRYVSFMCSNVFLFSLFVFIVSVMISHACSVFNIWFEYLDLPLLLLTACICSLYLVWNVILVFPMYFNGQFRHITWYMPLFSYLIVYMYGVIMFCIVSCVPHGTIPAVPVEFNGLKDRSARHAVA
jgi:hypothetical protein